MSPRIKHLRYSHFERLRYSQVFLEWLEAQATRLSSSADAIYARLQGGESVVDIENSVAPPTNTALPTLSGPDLKVGTTMTGTVGSWSGSPTLAYQWQYDDGTAIDGATELTYVLAAGDVGKSIKFTVTATNSAGSATASTGSVGPVVAS